MDPVPTFNRVFEYQYQLIATEINAAKSPQNSRKQFASRRNSFPTLDPGSYLDYTSIHIHLLSVNNSNVHRVLPEG